MHATIRQHENRVAVKTPYRPAIKDALKAVPTAKWEASIKCWTFEKVPSVIKELLAVFDAHNLTPNGKTGLLAIDEGKLQPCELLHLKGPKSWLHQIEASHKIGQSYASYIHGGMGVGKSKAVIDTVINYHLKRVLIVCPASVVMVWPVEFRKYAALPYEIFALDSSAGSVTKRTNKTKFRIDVLDAGSPNAIAVIAINYEAVYRKPFSDWILSRHWDLIVLDEGHKIKSSVGVSSKFCAKLRPVTDRYCGMSGTPMPHSPQDVFAQFRALDPGIYGTSLTRFRLRYEATTHFILKKDAKPPGAKLEAALFNDQTFAETFRGERTDLKGTGFGIDMSLAFQVKRMGWSPQEIIDLLVMFRRDILKQSPKFYGYYISLLQKIEGKKGKSVSVWKNLDELRAKMDSITLRIDRDVLDLPDALDTVRYVELEKEERRVHDELWRALCADVKGGRVTAANGLVRLLKVAQAISGFVKTEEGEIVELGSSRKKTLVDTLGDLGSTEPVVVFCRFHRDLDAVISAAEEVTGYPALEFSGRKKELAEWQIPGAPPILAVQTKAGGLGVDLTRACYAIYYSMDFSLGDRLQARARVHRPGQERSVTHIHLVAKDAGDVIVYEALRQKKEVIDFVLDHMRTSRKEI